MYISGRMDRRIRLCGKNTCLICNDKISSMSQQSNVTRHFDTLHATFASRCPAGDSRKKACQELVCKVQASHQQLCARTRQGDFWNSASFAGALAVARNGRPLFDVANELDKTVHNRTVMMANQVEETQVNVCIHKCGAVLFPRFGRVNRREPFIPVQRDSKVCWR